MYGVATRGTAAKATRLLKRDDIAGKTGTTNNALDAWFCGFAGNQVAISWMGYDTPRPLGQRETGGGLALPIWIDYMRVALKGVPDYVHAMPDTVVESNGELFYAQPVPGSEQFNGAGTLDRNEAARDLVRDQIF